MRLFIAINLPAAERARIVTATHALRLAELPVRWVEPDALHLTLKFLGEVADAAGVETALGDVASRHSPFVLHLRGAGAFPSARRASVLWVGVAASAALVALQQDVERAIAPLGFPTEARPFTPHLTIGRVQRGARAPAAALEHPLAAVQYDAEITIESLDLMQSHLSPRGARYERLRAAELAA